MFSQLLCHTNFQELALLVRYVLHSFLKIKKVIYNSRILKLINEYGLELAIKCKIHVAWAKRWRNLKTARLQFVNQCDGMPDFLMWHQPVTGFLFFGLFLGHSSHSPSLRASIYYLKFPSSRPSIPFELKKLVWVYWEGNLVVGVTNPCDGRGPVVSRVTPLYITNVDEFSMVSLHFFCTMNIM
jgi:hypothetical protein